MTMGKFVMKQNYKGHSRRVRRGEYRGKLDYRKGIIENFYGII